MVVAGTVLPGTRSGRPDDRERIGQEAWVGFGVTNPGSSVKAPPLPFQAAAAGAGRPQLRRMPHRRSALCPRPGAAHHDEHPYGRDDYASNTWHALKVA